MEKEIMVEVKGLSKKFSRSLKRSLWYGLKEIANTLFGIKGDKSNLQKDEFWAVRDINFQLRRGECLGLIGHNGAGKSTLLKMLNGLIRPDEGSIMMRGKVGALIELGAGFNPLLTGRENIYVNGQLIGFSKKEIDEKLDAILDFAEIGEFIDAPIQNYSSGMKVRLGFAIAAQMEPDVLIIDEVLAVGDLGFILKCINTIDNLMENTAIIFVSHSMPMVSRMCTDIILMDHGSEEFQGKEISKAIDLYYTKFAGNKGVLFSRGEDAELESIRLVTDNYENNIPAINWYSDLKLEIIFKLNDNIPNCALSCIFFDKEQRPIGICINDDVAGSAQIIEESLGKRTYCCKLTLKKIQLSKGLYSITIYISESLKSKSLLRVNNAIEFLVKHEDDVWQPMLFKADWGE